MCRVCLRCYIFPFELSAGGCKLLCRCLSGLSSSLHLPAISLRVFRTCNITLFFPLWKDVQIILCINLLLFLVSFSSLKLKWRWPKRITVLWWADRTSGFQLCSLLSSHLSGAPKKSCVADLPLVFGRCKFSYSFISFCLFSRASVAHLCCCDFGWHDFHLHIACWGLPNLELLA